MVELLRTCAVACLGAVPHPSRSSGYSTVGFFRFAWWGFNVQITESLPLDSSMKLRLNVVGVVWLQCSGFSKVQGPIFWILAGPSLQFLVHLDFVYCYNPGFSQTPGTVEVA